MKNPVSLFGPSQIIPGIWPRWVFPASAGWWRKSIRCLDGKILPASVGAAGLIYLTFGLPGEGST